MASERGLAVFFVFTVICGGFHFSQTYGIHYDILHYPHLEEKEGIDNPIPKDEDLPCPPVEPKQPFNVSKMMGHWYVIEYYSNHAMNTPPCLSFNMSLTEKGYIAGTSSWQETEGQSSYNFMFEILDDTFPAEWLQTRNGYHYTTTIYETDYNNWAIMIHCSGQEFPMTYMSTSILGRTPLLPQEMLLATVDRLQKEGIETNSTSPVDHHSCAKY